MASTAKTAFAALFGILYWLFGLTMITAALVPPLAALTEPSMIPADPAAGFVLCVVGTVFFFACSKPAGSTANGHAFLYVGMALSVIFGIIALLSILAAGADLVLFGEGGPWGPEQLLVPMVWLAVLPAIGLYTWGRGFIGDLTGA